MPSDNPSFFVTGGTLTPNAPSYLPRRAATGIDEVLGEAKPEVWVSDLFSAQLKNPAAQHQGCLAHQVRDLQYVIDAERSLWAYRLQELFRRGMGLAQRREELPEEHYRQQVAVIEAACEALLAQTVTTKRAQALQQSFFRGGGKVSFVIYSPIDPR